MEVVMQPKNKPPDPVKLNGDMCFHYNQSDEGYVGYSAESSHDVSHKSLDTKDSSMEYVTETPH